MSYAIHNKDKVFQQIDYIKRQLDMLYEENMQFKTTIQSNIQSYNKLSKYNDELEDRIDKAIEYINKNWGHWCSNHEVYATETINILQGSDKK